MKSDLKPETLKELNGYVLVPGLEVKRVWAILEDGMEDMGIEYDSFRDAIIDLMDTPVGTEFRQKYMETKEGPWDDDDYRVFCLEHGQEIAEENGLRIMARIK